MKNKYLKPELEFIELEKVYTDEGFASSQEDPEHTTGGDVTDPDGETNTEQNADTSKGGENTNEWKSDTNKENPDASKSPDSLTDALKQGVSEIISDVSNAITDSLEEIGQEELPEGENAENPVEGEITTGPESEEPTDIGF